jgi:hypothetical protein
MQADLFQAALYAGVLVVIAIPPRPRTARAGKGCNRLILVRTGGTLKPPTKRCRDRRIVTSFMAKRHSALYRNRHGHAALAGETFCSEA